MRKLETFSTVCKTAETPSGKFRVVSYADTYNVEQEEFEFFNTYTIELFRDCKQDPKYMKMINIDDSFFDRFADISLEIDNIGLNISDLFHLIFLESIRPMKFSVKDFVDFVQLLIDCIETNIIEQNESTLNFHEHAKKLVS